MTLVIGRKSSGVSELSLGDSEISMYGSHAERTASEYDCRSMARSLSDDFSEWHLMPKLVPNSRNARRYLMLRER